MIFSKSFLFSASSFDRVRISTSTCSPDLGAVKSGCKSLAAGEERTAERSAKGGTTFRLNQVEACARVHTFGGRDDKVDFSFPEKHQGTRELVSEQVRLVPSYWISTRLVGASLRRERGCGPGWRCPCGTGSLRPSFRRRRAGVRLRSRGRHPLPWPVGWCVGGKQNQECQGVAPARQ